MKQVGTKIYIYGNAEVMLSNRLSHTMKHFAGLDPNCLALMFMSILCSFVFCVFFAPNLLMLKSLGVLW